MRFFAYSRRFPVGVSAGFWTTALIWTIAAPFVFVWAAGRLLGWGQPRWYVILCWVFIVFLLMRLGH